MTAIYDARFGGSLGDRQCKRFTPHLIDWSEIAVSIALLFNGWNNLALHVFCNRIAIIGVLDHLVGV